SKVMVRFPLPFPAYIYWLVMPFVILCGVTIKLNIRKLPCYLRRRWCYWLFQPLVCGVWDLWPFQGAEVPHYINWLSSFTSISSFMDGLPFPFWLCYWMY